MSQTTHPFSADRIEAIANDYGVEAERLEELLARVQDGLDREDGGYEYSSSEYNYGWQDDRASYFYGSADLWEWLRREVPIPEELLDAVRAVHYEAMVESAGERDERESVEEMLADGNEPLVVTNTSEGPPAFGQGDSV